MDGVKRDAERLGIRNWRTKAMHGEGWRLVIESAQTLHGLCSAWHDNYDDDLLRAGRYGDRILTKPLFPCRAARLHATQPSVQGYQVFPGDKAAGAWC
jgi:hypothetical protein